MITPTFVGADGQLPRAARGPPWAPVGNGPTDRMRTGSGAAGSHVCSPAACCRRPRTLTGWRTPRRALSRVVASASTPEGSRASVVASTSAPEGSRAAVVTTVKNFGALAHSWCTYHLGIGFAHLFIFFDDPAELAVIGLEERFGAERVTCVAHDDALRAAWATLPNADAMLAHAETEVQSRQQLNAWLAVDLAASKGLDWLLHIDADEVFHPGADVDAPAHFAELSRAGVATFCYMNHEGVPEASGIVDPFVEVTLFKRSLDVVERTDAAREAVGLWDERLAGSYFFYYDNGKAAVRLTGKPRPLSVHEWLPGSAEGMGAWYSNLRTPWAGRGRLKEVVQYMSSSACILHYPCYNADTLWTRWKRGNDNCECRPRELANPRVPLPVQT